jgi:predicted dehydrogenase
MVDAVERAGVVNQVGLVLRDSPDFRLLRHLVSQPDSGRPMSVVFRDDQYIPVQGQYGSTWRADPKLAGSGALLEHSIHDIDILEWLLGPIASVSATSSEFHGIAGIEDAVSATLRFENDAVGSLVSIWHDLLERPSLRRVEVFCERAHCSIDDEDTALVRWTRPDTGGSVDRAEQAAGLAAAGLELRNPDRAFIEAAASGEPATPDFATAQRAHVVTDALYRSAAAGGTTVDVGPDRAPTT